jgi:hypothetical protein
MASNINSASIDEQYPVAGQDNDSQGFRDNFSTIKTSLAAAKAEIEDLQDNTAKTNAASNFNGQSIIDADFQSTTEKYFNIGTNDDSSSTFVIDFNNGHYQKIAIQTSITFNLTGWPEEGRLARFTIELIADDNSNTARSVSFQNGNIRSPNLSSSISITSNENPVIIEFWSYDGGNTIFANYLGAFTSV